jgi:CelD/BcsL family acetyltransferase involved in cellulose biosynthesis
MASEESGLAAEFHRWPLPGYLWPALHQLYQSIFCSEPHLRLHGSLHPNLQAWVSRSKGRITAVILFDTKGSVARIVNEMHEIDTEQLEYFSQALLREHPEIDAICLHAMRIQGVCQKFPLLQTEVSENYSLSLPESTEAWHASLSSQTREKLRYHYRRSCRKQPDLIFRQIGAKDITDLHVERVLQLNRARMAKKGRSFNMDVRETDSLRAVMRECGQISVIEIGGEICAGLLCTQLGKSVFMHVIAHDPRHDDLRLGFLCCALAIESAIASGTERFHFLWGYYDYKVRLGGQRQVLSRAVLFRSWRHALHHPGLLASQMAQRVRNKLRQWRQS